MEDFKEAKALEARTTNPYEKAGLFSRITFL